MAQAAGIDFGWERLREAQHFIAQRHADKAREALDSAGRAAGIDAELFLGIGDAWGELRDSNQARAFWRAAAARAAKPGVRSKANLRLAKDSLKRDRPGEAVNFLERYADDRPDDKSNLLRLLNLRLAGLAVAQRIATFLDFQARYPVLRDPLIEAALVLPFTDIARASEVLEGSLAKLTPQSDLAIRAVDNMIDAAQPEAALSLAHRLFNAKTAGTRELSCVLRAEKASGAESGKALEHYNTHLARFPSDHENRLKKAKLLLHLRRWHSVVEEGNKVHSAEPSHIGAAELIIRALVRLDRPHDARALRDKMVALHDTSRREVATALTALDLALADGATALERAGAHLATETAPGEASSARLDVLVATGNYAEALDLVGTLMLRSDDMNLRTRGVQCAAGLASWKGPETPFPEAAFRAAIGRRRHLPGAGRSVVLVSSTLGAGGAERQISMTASRIAVPLLAAGLETHLVCRDLRPEFGNDVMLPMLRGSPVQVTDLALLDGAIVARRLRASGDICAEDLRLLSAFPLPLYRTIAMLYEQFLKLKPEVVYLWQDGIICAGGVAAMLAGVPRVVLSIRNVVPPDTDTRRARSYLGAVYRALAQRSEVLMTANSEVGARDYEHKFGLPPGSIEVIRNGLEVSALRQRAGTDGRGAVRAELHLAPGEALLGAVYRLVPAKRPHRWLQVAARVAQVQPKSKFLIVGDGPLRAELEDYATQLGIGDRIFFAGQRSPVEPWIAAMDVMLLSSHVEGLPNVLIEAQALGVPVVTTDAGGAREAVDDGVTGAVVMDDDVDLLAQAVLCYMTDQDRHSLARQAAPEFIARRFGIDRMVCETLQALGFAGRVTQAS